MSRSIPITLKIPWTEFKRFSVIVLIFMNMVPILGIIFWDWKVFPLMFLFWTENLVIGLFNVLKMLCWSPQDKSAWKTKIRYISFFCLHYGIFAFVHGLLIVIIFGGLFFDGNPLADFSGIGDSLNNQGSVWSLLASLMSQLFTGIWNYLSSTVSDIWINLNAGWAVAALVISHGVSLIVNYFGKGEYTRSDLNQLMIQPYERVIILHVVILIGGFLVMLVGAQVIGLILLVALKTYIDIQAHLKQHSSLTKENPDTARSIS